MAAGVERGNADVVIVFKVYSYSYSMNTILEYFQSTSTSTSKNTPGRTVESTHGGNFKSVHARHLSTNWVEILATCIYSHTRIFRYLYSLFDCLRPQLSPAPSVVRARCFPVLPTVSVIKCCRCTRLDSVALVGRVCVLLHLNK